MRDRSPPDRALSNFSARIVELTAMDSPISDQALWRLVMAGDLGAFRRLYERPAVGVEAFCLRRTPVVARLARP